MATIRKRGERQWEVRVRRKGYPTTCKTFETKAAAQGWATIMESEMKRHVFVDRGAAESTTLHEALDRYLQEVTSKKAGHQEAYLIKAWQRNPLALRPLTAVRSSDMAAYRDERLQVVGPKTVVHELNLISHLYNIARKEWGMGALMNPVADVAKPKLPPGRDRRLTAEEEPRLLAACAESRSVWLKPIVELALETTMRRGEVVALEWRHVDLERQVAHLPKTKNGEKRDVPLSTKAVEILKAVPRPKEGRVFPIRADAVTRAFDRACERAGIEGLRFHDQRHEATSRLFEKGLNVMEVASVTGHKTLQMLKRYTHLRPEDLARKLG